MQETIKALGMTFTPVETTVKGRRLEEFKLGERAHHCLTDNPRRYAGIVGRYAENQALGIFTDYGAFDTSYNKESNWYSPSDLIDGKPRSAPQTKRFDEIPHGTLFMFNGSKYVRTSSLSAIGEGFELFPFAQQYGNGILVTVIGTLTWSRT